MMKAVSVARRTLIEDAETWFCELDGIVDSVHELYYYSSRLGLYLV